MYSNVLTSQDLSVFLIKTYLISVFLFFVSFLFLFCFVLRRAHTLPPKVMYVCYEGGGYIVFTRSPKVCMIQKRPKPPLLNEAHFPLCLSWQKETQTTVHFFSALSEHFWANMLLGYRASWLPE